MPIPPVVTKMTNPENPEQCDSCGFETLDLKAYGNSSYSLGTRSGQGESHKWLCSLCAGTMTGTAYEYPEQFRGEINTMRAVCYIGNAILAEIRKAVEEIRSK